MRLSLGSLTFPSGTEEGKGGVGLFLRSQITLKKLLFGGGLFFCEACFRVVFFYCLWFGFLFFVFFPFRKMGRHLMGGKLAYICFKFKI